MFSKSRLNLAVIQRNITSYILLRHSLSESAVICRLRLKQCKEQTVCDTLHCVISEDD